MTPEESVDERSASCVLILNPSMQSSPEKVVSVEPADHISEKIATSQEFDLPSVQMLIPQPVIPHSTTIDPSADLTPVKKSPSFISPSSIVPIAIPSKEDYGDGGINSPNLPEERLQHLTDVVAPISLSEVPTPIQTPPNPPSQTAVTSIDYSRLTLEDKSCAIADFILENLIIETFTAGIFLREKLIQSYKQIVKAKEQRINEDISRYISMVFLSINESPEEQMDIFTRLNVPVTGTDMSRLMVASPNLTKKEIKEWVHTPEPVLSVHLYIRLEEELRDTEYAQLGLVTSQVERQHIAHKMIFDGLNEFLHNSRTAGRKGLPPTFLSCYKFPPSVSPSDCATSLEKAKETVLQWTKQKNGILPENFTCPLGQEDLMTDLIDNAREESLTKHLNQFVEEMETTWEQVDDEFLEVFLGVSEYVFDTLIEGTVATMISLARRRQNL